MAKTLAVAAQCGIYEPRDSGRMAATLEANPDVWPVWPSDLEAVIEEMTRLHGWTVLSVDQPPLRRTVRLLNGACVWQLYTYVHVEEPGA